MLYCIKVFLPCFCDTSCKQQNTTQIHKFWMFGNIREWIVWAQATKYVEFLLVAAKAIDSTRYQIPMLYRSWKHDSIKHVTSWSTGCTVYAHVLGHNTPHTHVLTQPRNSLHCMETGEAGFPCALIRCMRSPLLNEISSTLLCLHTARAEVRACYSTSGLQCQAPTLAGPGLGPDLTPLIPLSIPLSLPLSLPLSTVLINNIALRQSVG